MVSITQAAEVANRICLALEIKSVQLMWKKLTCARNDVNKMATKRNGKEEDRVKKNKIEMSYCHFTLLNLKQIEKVKDLSDSYSYSSRQ